MATIEEQIATAKAAGYSADEIAQHLSASPQYGAKIKTALGEGYSSSEILGHLAPKVSFAAPVGAEVVVTPSTAGKPLNEGIPAPRSVGGFVGNVVSGFGKLAGDVGTAILHPLDTTKGLLDVGAGALQNALPKALVDFVNKSETPEALAAGQHAIQVANAVGGDYKRKYGSVEALANTLYAEPVQAAADLSALFSGGAGLVGKTGMARTAAGLETLAEYSNPLTPIIPAAQRVGKKAAPLVEKVLPSAEKVASKIATEAAGPNLAEIRAVLNADKSGMTVSELLANTDRNQIQSLAALAREKDKTNFYSKLDKVRAADQQNQLNNLAGGATNTEILNNLSKSKESLNQLTTPMRETELAAANTGKVKQTLEQQAATLSEAATGKVDDVRRFVAARDRLATAGAKRGAGETGRPTPNKYTLEGEMSDAAERVATRAAEESRLYGEGARFAQNRADSLAAHGLKPLDTEGLIRDISAKLNNPKIGVSDVNRKVLSTVANKVKEWTERNGGVIDANALYEIRKNTVNEAIEGLTAGQDPTVTALRASQLLSETKPLIDDAIVKAGGTGWKNYLDTFATGMDVLSQRKLAQTARDLYGQKDKTEFIRLVRGENPELVEKIFGHGRNDIKVEMGAKYKALDNIANELERGKLASEAAEKGAAHLKDIAAGAEPKLRIPFFGVKATLGNAILKELSGKINTKTMDILENGFKSGKNFEDMLNAVPSGERGLIAKAFDKVNRFNVTGAAAASNALAPANRNQMRKD